MRKYIILLLLIVASVIGGYVIGRSVRKGAETEISERVDTLFIRDTIRLVPVEKTRFVDRVEYVPVIDTVVVRDTVTMAVPIEVVRYEDSLYRAEVSGYKAKLDWIEVYPEKVIVTKEVTKRVSDRWGVGVQGGVGVMAGTVSPYIGVGVSYNFLTW